MTIFFKRTPLVLALLAAASALSACGPSIMADAGSTALRAPDSFTYQSLGDYSCPTEDNVVPYLDEVFDGSQRYTVCTNAASPTKLLIEGWSSTDRTVCLFPLRFLDASHFAWKIDGAGAPIAVCYDASPGLNKAIDLGMTDIDGAIIVDSSERQAMAQCLATGMACPPYSVGRFR